MPSSAIRTAEIVFTAHPTFESARDFYAGLKEQAATFGRAPEEIAILPGLFPIIGRTEAEARDKFEALQDRIHPEVGLALLETYLGDVDLSPYPLDGPLPDLPDSNAVKSRQGLLVSLARSEGLSIRQLAKRIAGARGHWQVTGTATSIADQIEHWVRDRAADGFALLPPTFPADLQQFCAEVVPELRRRGLFRSDYTSTTLRGHLGLPQLEACPASSERLRASA